MPLEAAGYWLWFSRATLATSGYSGVKAGVQPGECWSLMRQADGQVWLVAETSVGPGDAVALAISEKPARRSARSQPRGLCRLAWSAISDEASEGPRGNI